MKTLSSIMIDLLNKSENKSTEGVETETEIDGTILTILYKYRNECITYKIFYNSEIILRN